MPCEDEHRGQAEISTSQEIPDTASKLPEARREVWKHSLSVSSEESNSATILIPDFKPQAL